MPRPFEVIPKTEIFLNKYKERLKEYAKANNGDKMKKRDILREWDVSPSVFNKLCGNNNIGKKILSGEKSTTNSPRVSKLHILRLAESWDMEPRDLIVVQPLPTTMKYYKSLNFSYYIDHNRRKNGEVTWFWEEFEVVSIKKSVSNEGIYDVDINMCNQFDESFKVTGALFNDRYFALRGSRLDASNRLIVIQATFTICDNDVLCGVWIGNSLLENRTAIYRTFISPRELEMDELIALTDKHMIDLGLNSNLQGWIVSPTIHVKDRRSMPK